MGSTETRVKQSDALRAEQTVTAISTKMTHNYKILISGRRRTNAEFRWRDVLQVFIGYLLPELNIYFIYNIYCMSLHPGRGCVALPQVSSIFSFQHGKFLSLKLIFWSKNLTLCVKSISMFCSFMLPLCYMIHLVTDTIYIVVRRCCIRAKAAHL